MKAGSARLVLLVEHDARSARLLGRMLRQDGLDVEVAVDGATAIARLGRHPFPCALVTDMWLPHASGMTVARRARALSPALPLILITSHAEQAEKVAAALDPRPVVLAKPLDYATLRREIRRMVGRAGHASAPLARTSP